MNYARHVSEIASACETVFGRKIEVKPRALHALVEAYSEVKLLGNQIARSSDLELFRQVLATSPACADALLRQDENLLSLVSGRQRRDGAPPEQRLGTYERLLRDVFKSTWPFPPGYNDSGIRVKLTGLLTETDIFSGCLQAGRFNLLLNDTAKAILTAVDLIEDGYVDPRGDDFLADLETHCAPLVSIDSSHSDQQLLLFLDDKNKIRLNAFGATSLGLLEDQLSRSGPFIFRGGVLQPAEKPRLFSSEAILELEDLINTPGILESGFQRFFEAHPEFLKALDFGQVHPQPILYKDDGSTLIPDFFLEKIDSGWHAIADLKRPYDHMVIRRKNRVYFAQWVQDAIAQLQFYKEWFDDSSNRRMFEQAQGISNEVYRPRMVLVAGRSMHFADDVERIRLLSATDHALSLWTYDDVLRRAKRYREFASGSLELPSDRGRALRVGQSTSEPGAVVARPGVLELAKPRRGSTPERHATSLLAASLADAVVNHNTGEGVIQSLSQIMIDPIGLRDLRTLLSAHRSKLVAWARKLISEHATSASMLRGETEDDQKIQNAIEAALLLVASVVGGSASRVTELLLELYSVDAAGGNVILDGLRISSGFPKIDFSNLTVRRSTFKGYSKFLSCKCIGARFAGCRFVDCLNPLITHSGFAREMFDAETSLGDLEGFFTKSQKADEKRSKLVNSEVKKFLRSFLKGDHFLGCKKELISFSMSVPGLSEGELQRMIGFHYLRLSHKRMGFDYIELTDRFRPSVRSLLHENKTDALMKAFIDSASEQRS